MPSKTPPDLGSRFGRLVVIDDLGLRMVGKSRKRFVRAACDCGSVVTKPIGALRSGNTTSCGCLRKELVAQRNTIHGHTKRVTGWSRSYTSWSNMIQRCTNPKHKDYHYYGGRGISVCKRWRVFKNFLEDMGNRPPGLSIERINNNSGYRPGNCKWATQYEQVHNARKRGTAR